mgnify:CR=1 FL=1
MAEENYIINLVRAKATTENTKKIFQKATGALKRDKPLYIFSKTQTIVLSSVSEVFKRTEEWGYTIGIMSGNIIVYIYVNIKGKDVFVTFDVCKKGE